MTQTHEQIAYFIVENISIIFANTPNANKIQNVYSLGSLEIFSVWKLKLIEI